MIELCTYHPNPDRPGYLTSVMKASTELAEEVNAIFKQSGIEDQFEWTGPPRFMPTGKLDAAYNEFSVTAHPGGSEGYIVRVSAVACRNASGSAPVDLFLGKTFDPVVALKATTLLTAALSLPDTESIRRHVQAATGFALPVEKDDRDLER